LSMAILLEFDVLRSAVLVMPRLAAETSASSWANP
jgi:hypothetical protein